MDKELMIRVYEYVVANPGCDVDQVAEATEASRADVIESVVLLIKSGKINNPQMKRV